MLDPTLKVFNPFTPEFMKWPLPSLNLDTSIVAKRFQAKISNRMANSVDPDETVLYWLSHYEPSHLDLRCLQRYLHWSAGMKWLIFRNFSVACFSHDSSVIYYDFLQSTVYTRAYSILKVSHGKTVASTHADVMILTRDFIHVMKGMF